MTALIGTLRSSIGKKTVMAVTGLLLLGFVIAHLLGNLQVYAPDDGKSLREYAQFLRHNMALLWGARLVLLGLVVAHILTAVLLWLENNAARPVCYAVKEYRKADYAARTMIVSGPIIALFVVYHLLHLTWGTVHPDFNEHDVYKNVVNGFRSPLASAAYIAAMALLGTHLSHGIWSMCQTVGINHPRYNGFLHSASMVVGWGLALGNISIPVAVLTGIVY